MLTDIFSFRYLERKIWADYGERERRLIVQSFNLAKETVPYYDSKGNESAYGKRFWKEVHDRLANELGFKSLSDLAYSYRSVLGGKETMVSGVYTPINVCENWAFLNPVEGSNIDRFIKDRLSLLEIVFRLKEDEIKLKNISLPNDIANAPKSIIAALTVPGDPVAGVKLLNKRINNEFLTKVEELNMRFLQAGCKLHYHNGMIQVSEDEQVLTTIENPFWQLVSAPEWQNVDKDMKEAVDQRDSGRGDPAFYAARALESAIKIISDQKGWTHGKENGAHNYIENLSKRASNYIVQWEADALKSFFSKVRNPFGHGAGSGPMPILTTQQVDYAIETCMTWTKSLIKRL